MEKAEQPLVTAEDLINPKVPVAIQRELVNNLPLVRYEGPITLVSTADQVKEALEQLESQFVLGFDTESRPVFRRGQSSKPSLLQLAGKDHVWLFQLHEIEVMEPVFEILADGRYLKVGVAIRDDIKKLNELVDFEPAGFVEISDLTQRAGIVNTGLRNLTALFLQYRISKGAQVSNWAKRELSNAQIRYAATDAWVSRELYVKLDSLNLATPEAQAS